LIKVNYFMEKKTKILYVIPRYVIGGAEKLVLDYAKLLDKNKYEIHVASCVEDGELREQFEKVTDVYVYLGSKRNDDGRFGAYLKLWKYVKKIKPNIIHTHLLSADFFGFVVKLFWKENIFWITTMHNVEGSTSFWKKFLWSYILKNVDKAIVVSKSVEKFTLEKFKVEKNKCILLLNGVDTTKWLQVSMDKLFTHNKVQLASVGRFWEQKGHVYLLQALSTINSFDYELHLFGDGPLKKELVSKSKELGIYEKIVWHGVVPNVVDYVLDMDIVVQPSLWEGLSLVVMEMMTAGRPVVVTPPAGEELLENKKNGYIVPIKDIQKLAEIITYIANNKQEAIEIAKKARDCASKNFDIKKNIIGLEKIYDNLDIN